MDSHQSDRYLSELVRYIHLNPVRARIVNKPEDYEYSSHRAYVGLEPTGMVDVDPVLRHFGVKKTVARERYGQFVAAGMKLGSRCIETKNSTSLAALPLAQGPYAFLKICVFAVEVMRAVVSRRLADVIQVISLCVIQGRVD